MGVWFIVIISVIIGAVANEEPNNSSSFPLKEVKAIAESRVLERVEHVLQSLSAKIKVLEDQIDGLLVGQNSTHEMIKTASEAVTQRIINLEHKLESLPQIIRDTNQMIKTVNESFTQRIINPEQKLERPLEDTGVFFMKSELSKNKTVEVSRDLTNNHGFGDNWIVFQRRINGSVDFNRNWTEYREGFGDLRGEHWLGLDKLHAIVKTRRHELLIVLEDFDGVIAYAHYDDFKIGDESEKYIIKSVGKYTGTAGDSFTYHKDSKFSTYDQDNDTSSDSCSEIFKGAWWFEGDNFCRESVLNGEYFNEQSHIYGRGITWDAFRGYEYSLKSTKMMVRPVA